MSQYEIAKMVFNSDSGMTVRELMNRTGCVESTVRTSLHKLIQKGLVSEDGKRYIQHPDANRSDLESIKTYSLSDMLE
jgi:DNA-binding IclR family transcriptional regulator